MSVEAIAERIDAPRDEVAWLLADEAKRGRVRETPDGAWSLVADAFAPGTVEALIELG